VIGAPRVGAHRVREKTQQVVDHHHSDEHPGKPLYLLIPGGLLALASLALVIYLLYLTYYLQTLEHGLLYSGSSGGMYVGSVGAFCYGYELYDWRQALRLTAAIVFFTLAAVIIIAVLFAALAASASDKKSSRSSSSSSSSWWDSLFRSSTRSSRQPAVTSSNGWSDVVAAFRPLSASRPAPQPAPPLASPPQAFVWSDAPNDETCWSCGARRPLDANQPDADGRLAACPQCGKRPDDPARPPA
jgi:hypothetical protein